MDQTQQTAAENGTAADPNAPDKVERTYHKPLSCPMSEKERRESNGRLLSLLDMIDNETAAMDATKKLAKAKIEEHEAEVKRIRLELNLGKIDKPVECEEQFFYRVGLVRDVRKDTGETIDERAMTPEERQPSLPLGDEGEDSTDETDTSGDAPVGSTSKGNRRRKKNAEAASED